MDVWHWIMFFGLQVLNTASKHLDDYINNYEELHYDTDLLHQRHLRFKRSTSQPHLVLNFTAFNREFELQLEPDASIFTRDFTLQYGHGSAHKSDLSFIYNGKVRGQPTSYVHGSIINGVFRGFIILPGDTVYHVEHVRRFLRPRENVSFHSVIYRRDDLDLDPYRHRRSAGEGTCGVNRYRERMEEMSIPQNIKGNKYDRSDKREDQHLRESQLFPATFRGSLKESSDNRYGKTSQSDVGSSQSTGRARREIPTPGSRLGSRNTCYMYLRSDPILWRYIKRSGVDDSVAKAELLALFASHVAAINVIYKSTNFTTYHSEPTNYYYYGVQFRLQRTSVMTDESEQCNTSRASRFCNPDIDVSNFLDLTSRENHDQFCLAFTFTARDFSGGTLGLAWVASPENSAGGICEKNRPFPEDGRTVSKSLNTGIVTLINYGKRVAPTVSHLTFAHEVGHNFGSPHDTGLQCAPYGTRYAGASEGNYIMYASATHGDLPHNKEFSVCSKDNITRVLHSVIEEKFKKNCLQDQKGAFCGNGIVEDGEECDCGYLEDCDESCCSPRHDPQRPSDCKLRSHVGGITHVQCSPSEGPCCTDQCQFVSGNGHQVCRSDSECVESATCSGDQAACPEVVNKADIVTLCNDKLSSCQGGVCSGSLCKSIGYSTNHNKSYWDECSDKSDMCFLSCQLMNETCVSSAAIPKDKKYDDFREVVRKVHSGMTKVPLPAGSPCDDYNGYCDVFSRCRGVDNNGPLARLQNLIFGTQTWTMIGDWIIEHWWVVLLAALGLVLLMILFIRICGVNTPSYDPKHKPVAKVMPIASPRNGDMNREYQQSRGQYLDDGQQQFPRQHNAHHGNEMQHIGRRQKY